MSSTDSSSSRLSSDTPSLSIQVPKKKKKKSTKDKGTDKLDQGKNEGVNPNWAYVPPPGSVLIEEDDDADAGEFDWDKINDDDDLELCLIRVPDSVSYFYPSERVSFFFINCRFIILGESKISAKYSAS